ncbi:hypothetical protein O988_02699 [Pseudogymnoascus sp. VKM F-3808]|nr:hypothetical protein O988_02699 [Pseudogymnoascus sp. VKM F-3808]
MMEDLYMLPCSPQLLCEDRFSLLDSYEMQVPFWELFNALMVEQVNSPQGVIDILEYIAISLRQKTETDYCSLRDFMMKLKGDFYTRTWPALVKLALEMPALFPKHYLTILSPRNTQVKLSRRQTACLVVHQFLCTLTAPTWQDGYQDFHIWYTSEQPHAGAVDAYLTALFTYFDRITDVDDYSPLTADPASWPISYTLHTNQDPLPTTKHKLLPLEVLELPVASTSPEVLGIPDGASVISANKFIGFGRTGTQEETHVGASPECCPAVLVTPPLEDNQALVVVGPEAMVAIAGYGRDARCAEVLRPSGGASMHHRKWAKRTMLFVDALELDVADRRGGLPDVLPGNVERELRKAYTGFRASHVAHEGGPREPFSVIYTGFWGCRTFGGNPDIKALIQWCAASLAGSPMKFICSTSEQHAFAAALRRFAEYASVTGVGANELLGILLDLTPGELEGQQQPMEHIRKILRRDTR